MVKKQAMAVKYKLTTAAREENGALQALTLCSRIRAFSPASKWVFLTNFPLSFKSLCR